MADVGLSLTLFGLPIDQYAPVAAAAEAAGYDAVWLADHLVTPTARTSAYPYTADGDPGYTPDTPIADVWVNAGSIATATATLRIGTGVYVLPLRPVLVTARAAATVQALSGGRFLFGIGTGWLRDEFDAADAPFEARGHRADEAIDTLRRLWTGRPDRGIQVSPAADPPIPVIVGGAAPPALRRAGLRGDGWYGPACTLGESIAARDRIEAERAAAGRTGAFTYHVRLVGPPEPATVARYLDAGFTDLVVPLAPIVELTNGALDRKLTRVQQLADTLLP
jgi:alkanesulfonate monooxygenase SsuD/methylene tetrahydromethanopterin reductase-like flavin-dependent oxidoreductase (luciferase family)